MNRAPGFAGPYMWRDGQASIEQQLELYIDDLLNLATNQSSGDQSLDLHGVS
jgi:hypothetical protein